MKRRLARIWLRVRRLTGRAMKAARDKATAISELWRSSLQFRVTASTVALTSAVVFIIILVVQYQITGSLLNNKRDAAVNQARVVLEKARSELAGSDASADTLKTELENTRNGIIRPAGDGQAGDGPAAGAFEPVLIAPIGDGAPVAAGDPSLVPEALRRYVEVGGEDGPLEAWQIHTVAGQTYLVVGEPVREVRIGRSLGLYLLFPLGAEQQMVGTVQNTLLAGGAGLLVLVALIANLVARQVVRPVRKAATAASRFAEGEFEQRLPVTGSDDLAKLATSYNEMAASIQEQIRQLEEFGQLQRRFTSDVSHELRTPLTTVRMAADVLYASREQFPAGLARSTELLGDELDRFEALLGDLLEISRLDAGVEELIAEEMDLRPVVARVREQVRGLAGSTGSPIELDIPADEVVAEIDARRVERIVRNLVANAVDHGEGLPVRVIVRSNESAVAIAVRDYGVGLLPGEAELVFNRFWRADPSRNRRTGGTGLGLAISHEDARLHGGELVAWGEPGHGSCFRLTLPRTQTGEITESPVGLPPDPPDHRVRPADAVPARAVSQTADGAVKPGAVDGDAGAADLLDHKEVGR